MTLTVHFAGSGDAFGSGGRFQTCISLRTDAGHALLDCGATSLTALKQQGIDPGSVDAVFLTHLHGDHFGGVPFLVLDGQFNRRERPLTVAGPPGTAERVRQAMEVFFPGSAAVQRRFELRLVDLPARAPAAFGPFTVTGFPVTHASGAPPYALRVETEGRTLAYSGDTEWDEALLDAAHEADLFICEAYMFEREVKFHLSYAALQRERTRFTCRRLILTHMHPDMLARTAELAEQCAEDGLTITL